VNLNSSSALFSTLWAIAETLVIVGGGFKAYMAINRKIDRINYALFNDGVHGVVQQVADLHDNQQIIKTDIEVMKAKMDSPKPRVRKAS
jgi:hypothetical protein